MYKPDKIVVIDLEATCWEEGEVPIGSSIDILEIGICNLVIATGEITDKQSIYVIPERSEITSYCTELTGITHDLIREKGIPFTEACKIVSEQYEPEQRLWAGYGEFDRRQLEAQCSDLQVPFPMGYSYLNIMPLFCVKMKLTGMRGLKRALRTINEPFDGQHHNGADDAYNAAKVLRYILS